MLSQTAVQLVYPIPPSMCFEWCSPPIFFGLPDQWSAEQLGTHFWESFVAVMLQESADKWQVKYPEPLFSSAELNCEVQWWYLSATHIFGLVLSQRAFFRSHFHGVLVLRPVISN